MDKAQTARAIRKAMAHKDLRSYDLAKLVGVSETAVCNWRKIGQSDIHKLDLIASHCDLTLEEMLEMGK
jgi:hypothetical protein